MTTQTEALKLALEAMQRIQDADMDCDFLNVRQADQLDEAITALRQALAEQPAQQCVCGEPETSGTHRTDGPCYAEQPAQQEPLATLYGTLPVYDKPAQQDIPDLIAGALGVSRGTAYDMMREALAEQQEPVAKVYRHGKASNGEPWHGVHWFDEGVNMPDGTLLYTAHGITKGNT